MVRIAPRYDQRLIEAVLELDDRKLALADVYRRVAAHAERIGLTRPSYVNVRRLINAKRELEDERAEEREAKREIAADVTTRLLVAHHVDPYDVERRVRNARRDRS